MAVLSIDWVAMKSDLASQGGGINQTVLPFKGVPCKGRAFDRPFYVQRTFNRVMTRLFLRG